MVLLSGTGEVWGLVVVVLLLLNGRKYDFEDKQK